MYNLLKTLCLNNDMKKTSLHETHLSLGAKLEHFSGWLLPKSFGDEVGEYNTVRNSVGIVDLSYRGKIILSGKEHLKFLQGILTNDVNKLEVGKGLYATFLTPKGRIIADMRLYRRSDSVLIDLEPGLNEKVTELFLKYKISYKVNIEDSTETLSLMSIQGPSSKKLIEKTFGEKIPVMNEYDYITKSINGTNTIIAKANRTGEEGFDIYIQSDGRDKSIWDHLVKNGEEFQIKPVGLLAMETLRIEAGIPRYGVDMNENTIPIEAGLWHALSFEKGCYVGQEVIARIKWRGHVNWHLVGFEIYAKDISINDSKIFDGERDIGYITSSSFSPMFNKVIALGYIRREFNKPGTKVSINTKENKKISAKVVNLPFYNKS